jgi:AraC-like DNA-binding protein
MLTGLIALTLGARGDDAGIARDCSVRAARLRAIKADIVKTIDSDRLSVNTIAARHRVTPRYVQTLFAAEGTTFTQFVLRLRLARAYRLLTDPRFPGPITTVAFDAGFGDVSYFNHRFRRRFGMTPSQVRAEAAAQQRS